MMMMMMMMMIFFEESGCFAVIKVISVFSLRLYGAGCRVPLEPNVSSCLENIFDTTPTFLQIDWTLVVNFVKCLQKLHFLCKLTKSDVLMLSVHLLWSEMC